MLNLKPGDLPLLGGLSRLELARLVPDIIEVVYSPGEAIRSHQNQSIFFVRAGQVELYSVVDDTEVLVDSLQEGDLFGEASLLAEPHFPQMARARTHVLLNELSVDRLLALVDTSPGIAQQLLKHITARLNQNQTEYARAKMTLVTYSEQLWNEVDRDLLATGANEMAAAGAAAELAVPVPLNLSATPAVRSRWTAGALKLLGFSASIGAAVAVSIWLDSGGLSHPVAVILGVLLWAVINWLWDLIPDYAVGVGTVTAIVVLKLTSAGVAFSGYANPTWFLTMSVIGMGAAIGRSGLLFRAALYMLWRLPPTYIGQCLALALTGAMLTPILPSPNGRVAIAAPLALELAGAMRFQDRSPGSVGLGMSVLLGFSQMSFLFLNGTASCILMWSLLPPAVRQQSTWFFWFLAAIPMGIFFFAAGFASIVTQMRPAEKAGVSRATIAAQLTTLGPMSTAERATLTTMLMVLLGFITQPWHGIDQAWVTVSGLLFLIATGVLDRETMKKGVDWNFLLLYGAFIGLAATMEHVGLTGLLVQKITVLLSPVMSSPVLFLLAVGITTGLLRIGVPMVAASLLMSVAMYPLAGAVGVNPLLVALTVQVANNPWFMRHQNNFYQTLYSCTQGRAFSHPQVRKLALLQSAIALASVLISIPWWHWLGLM